MNLKKYILALTIFICTLSVTGQTLNVSPNPFNSRTLLTYSVSANDTVSIDIYNIAGQLIYPIKSNFHTPTGNYQDSLILDNFPSGIYYLMLKFKVGGSKVVKLIKTAPVGITINEPTDFAKIYPNPFKDALSIDFTNSNIGIRRLEIINYLGQIVFQNKDINASIDLDLNFLPSGIYNLNLQSDFGQKVFKVVKE